MSEASSLDTFRTAFGLLGKRRIRPWLRQQYAIRRNQVQSVR